MTAVLSIQGRRLLGWKSVQIVRSLETLSGSFTLSLTDRDPTTMRTFRVSPGNECTVSIGDQTVITGHVDAVRVNYDARNHELEVVGRDSAGDLVDCSAAITPGEWLDTGLEEIVNDLCSPFGIAVNVTGDAGEVFKKFRIETGETVYEAIDRLCRFRALLAWSDGMGGIEIGSPERTQASVTLEFGKNILRATGVANWSDRHSEYTVLAQQPAGEDMEAEEAFHLEAMSSDSSIQRHRPLVVVAEQGLDRAETQKRADWEASIRAARSRQIVVTVQGWRENGESGALWDFGRVVRVEDQWLGFSGTLLVASVAFSLSDAGTMTRLTLAPAEAFQPQLEEQDQPATDSEDSGNSDWWTS